MAYLFPIPLRGVGTTEVEGFGTYLHRLAIAHSISTGKFLAHVVSWYTSTHTEQQYNLATILATEDTCVFVRPNQTTEQLVEILTAATGMPNLRSGTFLALKDALERSMRTFVTRLRWCPPLVSG